MIVNNEENNFGFDRVETAPQYRSSIYIIPSPIDSEAIIPDAAKNLAYRAKKLIETMGWEALSTGFIISLTVDPNTETK